MVTPPRRRSIGSGSGESLYGAGDGYRLRPPRAPVDIVAQCAVAALFQAVVPLLARVESDRDPRARLTPRTVAVFSHKRDLDIPILIATLLGPRAWPRWLGQVTFIGSADLFTPGFLGYYFPQLGRPLRRLLAHTAIGPILRALRIVPVGASGPRLVAQWIDGLRAIYPADTPLGAVLSDRGLSLAAAANAPPDLSLAAARTWRYERLLTRSIGAELLGSEAYGRLRIHETRIAPTRLDAVAAPLQAGGVVVLAPEGQLSPNGALQPFRSGFFRLLRQTPDAVVLPTGISYDLLAGGRRPRLFFSTGAPLFGLAALPRRAAEERVHAALDGLGTVTLAHIVARVVFDELDGRPRVATAEFAGRAWLSAQRIAATGQRIDPVLRGRASFAARLAVLLREARGRGLEQRGGMVRLDWDLLARPARGWQENPLRYAFNESGSYPVWRVAGS